MSTLLGVNILICFLLSHFAFCRHTLFLLILRKNILAIFTKFGMQDYWISSLICIAFGYYYIDNGQVALHYVNLMA